MEKLGDLLFFIEIKAVQNAMGERGYDHGCYSDKSQSGKQSITGSKYFGHRRMESIHGVPFRPKSLKHSGANQSNSTLPGSGTLKLRLPSLRRGQEARG